jgi:hypothetical protein
MMWKKLIAVQRVSSNEASAYVLMELLTYHLQIQNILAFTAVSVLSMRPLMLVISQAQ